MKTFVAMLVGLALIAGATTPAWADGRARHSGTVAAVDRGAGRIVIDEVGPWQRRDGATVVTPVTVDVTRDTLFVSVHRAEPGATAWAGDWEEIALEPWEVLPGDFVTVDCRHDGPRMIALRVLITELR